MRPQTGTMGFWPRGRHIRQLLLHTWLQATLQSSPLTSSQGKWARMSHYFHLTCSCVGWMQKFTVHKLVSSPWGCSSLPLLQPWIQAPAPSCSPSEVSPALLRSSDECQDSFTALTSG
ncbi:uncharacterized protein LOC100470313 isoform X1 [Ailuropoda melanoleuca]|uniref:uncharacterized protein LOC100470313 isoform X1 n=1 Tax=Ailuropoda melanoleuca TaxID=9646 RepID=UPI001494D536|nr:uncharacterized protein LOC100470313 isoform X1 [Ailuropoda melanoleuca]